MQQHQHRQQTSQQAPKEAPNTTTQQQRQQQQQQQKQQKQHKNTEPMQPQQMPQRWQQKQQQQPLQKRTLQQPRRRKRRSRRINQRKRKRTRKTTSQQMNNHGNKAAQNMENNAKHHLQNTLHGACGFLPNLELTCWDNRCQLLQQMTPHHCFTRPNNMKFHNLCLPTTNLPAGTGSLLGLGLKFCTEPPKPCQDTDASLQHMRRSMRLHFAIQTMQENCDKSPKGEPSSYIPKLCAPSKWDPGEAPNNVEHKFDQFEKQTNCLRHNLPEFRRHNISPPQRHCLSELAKRDDLIMHPADKNLGPAVTERQRHIKQVIKDHLSDATNHEQTPSATIKTELQTQREQFLNLCNKHKHSLMTEAEITCFERTTTNSFLNNIRVPQPHGTFKVHKQELKTRPAASCINSMPETFSKWADHWLEDVACTILPTCARDTDHLMSELRNACPNGPPPGAHLFSVDAKSVHSNMNTAHGTEVINEWITTHMNQLPPNMPQQFVTEALSLIMENNIFQFGDTFWRQKSGCAMGTSTAASCAHLCAGLLETQRLLPNFQDNLPFFKQFIDDGVGTWKEEGNTNLPASNWNTFLRGALDNWGTLRWTNMGHANTLMFLDPEINVNKDRQTEFKTCQKPMNSHLHMPPGSAHPENMIRGLTCGRLKACWNQNTHRQDHLEMASLLAKRLTARGCSMQQIKPIFIEANRRLECATQCNIGNTQPPLQTNEEDEPVFFHLPFHPRGINRRQVRATHSQTAAKVLPAESLLQQFPDKETSETESAPRC